jgi:hypothetical protein
MPKLNQIVAVVAGKKTRTEKALGDLNKLVQKPELFSGLSRVYEPAEENGEMLPPESKFPQKNVDEVITQARELLIGVIDAIATQEYGNTKANADVVVDDVTLLVGVPITVLLYLEKLTNDLHTFVSNMPVLDPTARWERSDSDSMYRTSPMQTIRTKKVQKPLVLFPATDKHPAQTQLIIEDVTAGTWQTTHFSTALTATGKQALLARIIRLQDAIKVAREEANSAEVTQQKIADKVLAYIFG